MKKLLILGASLLQLPGIIRAKELGFYVGVVDQDENAIGREYADEFFKTSTTNVVEVNEIAKIFKPNGIITLATDMPMMTIAKVVKELSLTGISEATAIKSTNKEEMSKVFKSKKIESPWFHIIFNKNHLYEIKDQFQYPCIFKPTDSSGSRGVILVESMEEVEQAYNYSNKYSKSGNVIVQEYLLGKEVSVEIMVQKGVPEILAITDKLTTGAPFFVEMGHVQPSQLPTKKIEEVYDLAIRAVKAIGIESGPAHVEIISTTTEAKMIELGARLGGDYITSHLVPLSTGIDMIEGTINLACSLEANLVPRISKGSAIRYIKLPEEGKILSIEGLDEARKIKGIKVAIITKDIGETVLNIKSSVDRIGYVIAQGESAAEAIEICENALKKIKIITLKE